ncbi:hypothetical protein NHX12_026269 [Muraenolepis orangiensis]|uniref:Uncharacterized protein n=1 Tax=Muraenolepis orangiensis TaxID=630683 RepID=A0A9Q0EG80_9TELE|nr:hypothetical protein NHX12_026269 [Muraenolepis orangiensis]
MVRASSYRRSEPLQEVRASSYRRSEPLATGGQSLYRWSEPLATGGARRKDDGPRSGAFGDEPLGVSTGGRKTGALGGYADRK